MGRKKLPTKFARKVRRVFLLTPAEAKEVDSNALKAGKTLSEFAREKTLAA